MDDSIEYLLKCVKIKLLGINIKRFHEKLFLTKANDVKCDYFMFWQISSISGK